MANKNLKLSSDNTPYQKKIGKKQNTRKKRRILKDISKDMSYKYNGNKI